MDFGTIKNKLKENKYGRMQEFVEDMNLVFDNCVRYNGEKHQVGIMGQCMKQEFNHMYKQLEMDFYA